MATELSVDDVQRLMRGAVGSKLRGCELTRETQFEALGLTSLDLAEVLFAIEDHLDEELDPIGDKDPKTVGELLDQVNALLASSTPVG